MITRALCLATAAFAATAGVSQTPDAVLPWGTPVALDTTREISSKDVAIGQRIDLKVADDVVVAGRTVIAKGSPAVGEVSAVTAKGGWGQRGRLRIKPLYLRVGDRVVGLSGDLDKQGHNGTGGTVAAVAAIGVVGGFLVTGTSAVIPPGTGLNSHIDEDVPLLFSAPAVRPAVYAPRDAPAVVTAAR